MKKNNLEKLFWLVRRKPGIKASYEYLKGREDLLSPGLSTCIGCNAELSVRLALRMLGKNTILAVPPSCLGGASVVGFGDTMGAKVPVFFPLLSNTAATLAGVQRHFLRQGREVQAVAFAGDGGTADIGLQSLSGAVERGEKILYICYDNEGYMNTGIQRSATTPKGAWTNTTPVGRMGRGKPQEKKDVPLLMVSQRAPYVATASTAFVQDYLGKLQKATEASKRGLAYIHIFSPCPVGWKFSSHQTIEVGRRAVETRFFPLWEAEYGKIRITEPVRFPKPIDAYTSLVGKYRHLEARELREMQALVNDNYRRLQKMARL